MIQRLASIILLITVLGGCATGQDIYVGADIVSVIPRDKAIAYLRNTVRSQRTGYECHVFDNGIVFPSRPGMPNNGIVPFQQLRARTVWASFINGGTALVVLAEGQTGLLGGDRCVVYAHPNPGPIGTPPPLDHAMSKSVEALVSLGAQYSKPPVSSDGSLRVYTQVGI